MCFSPELKERTKTMQEQPQKSRLKGILQLIAGLFCMWLFIWHISPIIERNIPAFAQYKKVTLENDLNPSSLYYNDVHVTQEAAQNTRSTWLFYQSKKEAEEKLAEKTEEK